MPKWPLQFVRRLSSDPSDAGLRLAGLMLATGSCAFAAHMLSDSDRQPEFAGLEHLAIFAKPTTPTTRRPPVEIAAGRGAIDYTPIGTAGGKDTKNLLVGYVLLDATAISALIRTPDGAVIRGAPGETLAGVGRILSIQPRGGRWRVVTTMGVIAE